MLLYLIVTLINNFALTLQPQASLLTDACLKRNSDTDDDPERNETELYNILAFGFLPTRSSLSPDLV